MNGPGKLNNKFYVVLRWLARIIGSLMALFILFMLVVHMFGDVEGEDGKPPIHVILFFSLWIVGVILAWKWEVVGGGLLLLNSIVFFIVTPNAFWPPNPFFNAFPVTGILFLVCWLKSRQKPMIP